MSELVVELEEELGEQEGVEGGPIWTRNAVEVTDVSFPERTIELVVIPYERPTIVSYGSRMIEEVVTRGAFGKSRPRMFRPVNRDHDPTKAVGYVKTLYTNRDEGLVAKLYISTTAPGDETLVLANDRVLRASAGFGLLAETRGGRPKPGAEVWETKSRRRLNHLWLDHVAMVSNPAYDGTEPLDVRSQEAEKPAERLATPLLDSFRIAEKEREYADLDRQFNVR